MDLAYTAATMNVFVAFVLLLAAAASTQQRAPISADEVTLRHKIYYPASMPTEHSGRLMPCGLP